jgi:hypothetical protein
MTGRLRRLREVPEDQAQIVCGRSMGFLDGNEQGFRRPLLVVGVGIVHQLVHRRQKSVAAVPPVRCHLSPPHVYTYVAIDRDNFGALDEGVIFRPWLPCAQPLDCLRATSRSVMSP